MPVASKADNNVPLLPGRARYSIVNARSDTWVYMRGTLTGVFPALSGTPAGDYADPDVVGPGRVEWNNLASGGLFTLLGNISKPLLCSAVDITGGTVVLVKKDGTPSRPLPTVFPFVIAPGEYVKASGGTSVGLLLRIEDQTIL